MKMLREPLVHFLVLGATVFAVATLVGGRATSAPATSAPDQIILTHAQVERLAADFARFHRRPPSPEEQQGLIADYLREEVSYREALAMGLDRDDPVIRNRLREKMEFIFDDVGDLAEPTDQQLETYLHEHPDMFRSAPRVSFDQVYLDQHRRAASLATDATALLVELNCGTVNAAERGDPFLLDPTFAAITSSEVVALFGESFATALERAPLGRWQGPIQSGYGQHLVRVSARTPADLPPLPEIRDAVRREWLNAARQATRAKLYAALLARYSVTVEPAGG